VITIPATRITIPVTIKTFPRLSMVDMSSR
jgi:hypothetical protein